MKQSLYRTAVRPFYYREVSDDLARRGRAVATRLLYAHNAQVELSRLRDIHDNAPSRQVRRAVERELVKLSHKRGLTIPVYTPAEAKPGNMYVLALPDGRRVSTSQRDTKARAMLANSRTGAPETDEAKRARIMSKYTKPAPAGAVAR